MSEYGVLLAGGKVVARTADGGGGEQRRGGAIAGDIDTPPQRERRAGVTVSALSDVRLS